MAVWTYKNIHKCYPLYCCFCSQRLCILLRQNEKSNDRAILQEAHRLSDPANPGRQSSREGAVTQCESEPVSLRILIRVATTTVTQPLHLKGLQPST